MSYRTTDDGQAIVVGLVLGGGIVTFLLWSLSQALGADFGVTAFAVVQSAGILVVLAGIGYWLRPALPLLILASLVFLWPVWWDVLHSIAQGGSDLTSDWRHPMYSVQWYESGGFLYGSELVLMACWVGAWLTIRRRGY